ncbi:hypothetical protein BJ546DRAFT_946419 [Cryomyces antarcticus]
MSSRPGPIRQLWLRWKALKLPWRRQWLAGHDLAGNTFWEFKDQLNTNRLRRMARPNPKLHYSDIKYTPQWHQWLRHTRGAPPSLEEQQYDVSRQAQLKYLAQKADERWASAPSFLDAPSKQQPEPAIGVNDPGGYAPQTEPEAKQGVRSVVGTAEEVREAADGMEVDKGRFRGETREMPRRKEAREENPFKVQRGGPSENWEPAAWSPGVAKRR